MVTTLQAQARHARILVVDDEPSMRELLTICLRRAGHEVEAVEGGALALERLDARPFDLVITDLTMPGVDGLELLRRVIARPEPPLVIMITAFATTATAVEAMKLGAYDYLTKPFELDEIQVVVMRALERVDLGSENQRLRDELRGVWRLEGMVARSTAMQRVFELVRRVAPTRTNILIRGESGTGKELVARALHSLSDRVDGPFVAINCGAIPESLMESELFGHVKGAFTGAAGPRDGVFVAARGGTLFLDEIGDLSLPMQVKLLRALQERTIRPVGGDHEFPVDCRVVTATNRDLEAAIEAGEFRSDLYFRLDVVSVVLPPLRHRPEDVTPLVERFFERLNRELGRELRGITPEAMEWFLRHDYPGNVRELENLVERAVALEGSTMLTAANLPEHGTTHASPTPTAPFELPEDGLDLDQAVADLERHLISAALRRTRGVRKEAAKLLKITFRSLRYRLEKLGIQVASGSDGDG
ncbi:sigma-54-dependent transcriptional regulator [Paraliomyxa miuraensis]|uniref:sigma-54-dependent transcriptional regulator n=1 Tax=Paraliomyxa miuraensis TaxID=376150 RepID=UPI0022538502|nr:sigma-54 dependent transcriptional regulator [Paraliomyxa miuraensis]MCX4245853.1 sigma-54 dependent transcriptional regulator [Paraliomyxa miuraensis]